MFDLIPPNIDRYNMLFNTALKARSLTMGDRFGVEKAAQLQQDTESVGPPLAAHHDDVRQAVIIHVADLQVVVTVV